MKACGVCCIEYKDDDVLAETQAFMCSCKERVCIPCVNILILKKTSLRRDPVDTNKIIFSVDPDVRARCPFCRAEMPAFLEQLYGACDLSRMLMEIKMYKFFGDIDRVKELRGKYEEMFDVACPL